MARSLDLEFDYQSMESDGYTPGERTHRSVRPIKWIETARGRNLRAYCHMRDEVRTFTPHRMSNVRILHEETDAAAPESALAGILGSSKLDQAVGLLQAKGGTFTLVWTSEDGKLKVEASSTDPTEIVLQLAVLLAEQ